MTTPETICIWRHKTDTDAYQWLRSKINLRPGDTRDLILIVPGSATHREFLRRFYPELRPKTFLAKYEGRLYVWTMESNVAHEAQGRPFIWCAGEFVDGPVQSRILTAFHLADLPHDALRLIPSDYAKPSSMSDANNTA